MARFRKRPAAEVDAVQWFPGKEVAGVHLLSAADNLYYVNTAHGWRVYLAPGDWVIREPVLTEELYYSCKPDIFSATYEAVDG